MRACTHVHSLRHVHTYMLVHAFSCIYEHNGSHKPACTHMSESGHVRSIMHVLYKNSSQKPYLFSTFTHFSFCFQRHLEVQFEHMFDLWLQFWTWYMVHVNKWYLKVSLTIDIWVNFKIILPKVSFRDQAANVSIYPAPGALDMGQLSSLSNVYSVTKTPAIEHFTCQAFNN